MTYRDTFDTCPRCGVSLVDARSARSCSTCKGLWVEEPIVSEMVLEMLPPQPFGRLVLAVLEHSGDPLPCPTCKEPMQATEIHGVPLDRCAKQHGIWFDAGELQVALQRVADPRRPPPLGPSAPQDVAHATSPHPDETGRPEVVEPARDPVVSFRFVVQEPGEPVREVAVAKSIVKIGRVQTSHVRLADPRVARMHAIIDASSQGFATLIDLGSGDGTLVNGERVIKTRLKSGDQITVGATTIEVSFAFA